MNKLTRSRGGCAACLQQHRKCDEARPKCGRCVRVGIECDYKRSLRWCNGARLPRARRPRRPPRRESHAGSRPGADVERGGESSVTTSPAESSFTVLDLSETPRVQHASPGSDIPEYNSHTPRHSPPPERILERPENGFPQDHDDRQPNNDAFDPSLPIGSLVGREAADGEETVSHGEEETGLVAARDAEVSWSLQTPLDGHLCSMLFQDDGSHLAYLYFVQSVALILPGWSGVQNGYRQIAALALSSPTLLDTIVSVSTIYMHLRGIVPRSLALRRQSYALASLRRSVNTLTDSTNRVATGEASCLKRDVLATILLQITVEIANGTSFIQTHITNALALFRELGYEHARPTSPVGHVLLQRITFIDTLSAIFWRRRPLLSSSFWFLNEPEELQPDAPIPPFQETTGCPLPVITALARISHLAADFNDGLPTEAVMARAYEIEGDLALFARETSSLNHSIYPDADARHLDTVGQCYYWSAAILLQRTIFRDAHDSHRVQFCLGRLLALVAALPIGCGPDSQLSLPLYAAALAAGTEEQREAIRRKNVALGGAYPMKARTALTEVFEGMWGAMDEQRVAMGCGCVELVSDMMKEKALFIC